MFLKNKYSYLITMVCIISLSPNIQAEETEKPANKLVEITKENFKQEVLESLLPVVVKVGATWCQPCQQLAPVLEELVSYFPCLKFVTMDYDKNLEFVKEHNIEGVPTWMIYYSGKLSYRQEGCPPTLEGLIEFIKAIDNKFKNEK